MPKSIKDFPEPIVNPTGIEKELAILLNVPIIWIKVPPKDGKLRELIVEWKKEMAKRKDGK